MDMNEKPKLSGVPETMLQTVYARAKETKTRGAIKDTKAVEIIDKINYDFSLADKDSAMHSGVVARTIVLDKLANKYLAKSKGAVVVNIACGLDIRCYRMNGYTHWYNLDLPETIAVREKLLHESGEISQIAMSAMDDWSGEITEHDAPAIVIIEGLTMYLSEKDVKEIFETKTKVDGKEISRTRKLGMLDLLTFTDEFEQKLSQSGYSIEACIKPALLKCFLPLVSLEMLVPAVKIATLFPCGVYRLTKASVTSCKNRFQYRCIGLVSAKAYLTACKTFEKVFLFLFYLLGGCLRFKLERCERLWYERCSRN